eukprot:PLAT7428.1.p1 GENE.PLAT7428.1~~PLAT7428.1.p1  ORF type:complete len:462 (-),score=246.57 PLAT7428.1:132-1517(-)
MGSDSASKAGNGVVFPIVFGIIQLILILFFGLFTEYGDPMNGAVEAGTAEANTATYYSAMTDVSVMIFIGFGFLMTFLHKYGYGAVGLNFMSSSLAVQWGLLVASFFAMVHNGALTKAPLMVETLIEGFFAAGACMISFGAVIGRMTPLQLIVAVIVEIIFYGLNFYIGALQLGAIDVGGSMFVHTFGAYFGVAMSLGLGPKGRCDHPLAKARTSSDLFSMVGTVFLWILWPSFNGALAHGPAKMRVIVNTVLALCVSCTTAFIMSASLRKDKRFSMEHIQNATLAGGVAVGSSANLIVHPAGAMLLGMIGGAVSVYGYARISDFLAEHAGVADTCGVHNLHGLPGIVGAIGGIATVAAATKDIYGAEYDSFFSEGQVGAQVGALFITLGISLVGGWLTGKLLAVGFAPHGTWPHGYFTDETFFEVEDDFASIGSSIVPVGGTKRDDEDDDGIELRDVATA